MATGAEIILQACLREGGDDGLLAQIRDYNEDDCRSTRLLRDCIRYAPRSATEQ